MSIGRGWNVEKEEEEYKTLALELLKEKITEVFELAKKRKEEWALRTIEGK